MNSYLTGIDAITSASRIQKRASILSTLEEGAAPAVSPTVPVDGVGTLTGAAVGGILWADHRILGVIGGASVGRNLPAVFRAETRRAALCNMAQTGGAIVGSRLVGGNSTFMRVAGFTVGWLAAGAALYYGHVRND